MPANEPEFTFEIGGDHFHVVAFTAREKISDLFQIDLELATEEEVDFADVIGQAAVLTVEGIESERRFHGIVSRFAQTGTSGRFFLYQAQVVPSAWLLGLEQDCRIFQNKTVQEIIQQVMEDSSIASDSFDFRLQESYTARPYYVQYDETNLNFINRLCEQDGIFYFFEHSQQSHVMVFGDGTVNYQPIADEARIEYNPGRDMVAEEEAVISFRFDRRLTPGSFTTRDYNFNRPSLDLTCQQTAEENTEREIFEFPGLYEEQSDGDRLAQVRLQQTVMFRDTASGSSLCPRFLPGFTFTLAGHSLDSLNQEYLLTEVIHEGSQPQVLAERSRTDQPGRYINHFKAVPSSVTIRPERRTPRPRIRGVHTAVVVGPSGEEIYTDEMGRVKVQFFWDRNGQQDENSSCWIRVSQAWAGPGWGTLFIPRIGQEVVVDFVDGDPDRPIVTGAVYHGTNTPPWNLPDEKTRSGIRSESSTGGGGHNEIRLDDQADSEEIYIHAQKDMNIEVNNNQRRTVGGNDHVTIEKRRNVHVKQNCEETIDQVRKLTVKGNHERKAESNETIKITRQRKLEAASEDHKITGQRKVTAGSENYTVHGARTFTAGSETQTINGARNITTQSESKTITGNRSLIAAIISEVVSAARNLTVATENKTVANQQKFLGMDAQTDSGLKFENFAGMKVSNHLALLAELKQTNISVVNAAIGYTSFKLDQSGIEVKTKPLIVIG